MKDYELLYDGEWLNALPKGPVPGVLTNYTQELLFSMERLSTSPYAIRRLIPGRDGMPFWVDDLVTLKVAGAPLWALLLEGRLFYADHSNQANLPRTDRYAPACDALFFIDKTSGNFLPLAIRTGVGQSTIYTPEDSDEDWLLAKIMYNVNDFWFAQWNHLAATHQVLQITWLAAIRALSVEHPIHALLDRRTYDPLRLWLAGLVLTCFYHSNLSVFCCTAACIERLVRVWRCGGQGFRLYRHRGAGLCHSSIQQWQW